MKHVLVICSQRENYFELFRGLTLENGDGIIVDQAPWVDVEVASYPDNLVVTIRPNRNPFPGTQQHKFRTICPDFVLLRSYALGNHEHDWRKKIYGFYHHDVPCLNSIDSFVWSVEKAIHYTKLRRVTQSVPDFPLIPQTYYSHPHIGSFPPDTPCVLKVGSSSQGVGKARIENLEQWKDMLSLLAMTTEYFVTEPFVKWNGDVRVQKIGDHYRAILRKKSEGQTAWKANEGVGITETDVPVEDRWKRWLNAAAEELEMDICGMDVLVAEDGREFILEVNSSSIGFPTRHASEDCQHIRDLVLERMNDIFCRQKSMKRKKPQSLEPSPDSSIQSQPTQSHQSVPNAFKSSQGKQQNNKSNLEQTQTSSNFNLYKALFFGLFLGVSASYAIFLVKTQTL